MAWARQKGTREVKCGVGGQGDMEKIQANTASFPVAKTETSEWSILYTLTRDSVTGGVCNYVEPLTRKKQRQASNSGGNCLMFAGPTVLAAARLAPPRKAVFETRLLGSLGLSATVTPHVFASPTCVGWRSLRWKPPIVGLSAIDSGERWLIRGNTSSRFGTKDEKRDPRVDEVRTWDGKTKTWFRM
ncbi:hypothetical protein CCUS01_12624 [Colletotrichum cuscutae]|uniref:Uncharacterized protein n=1 Tax=Colletotrichum cuscutae TaxID=1209917 RepID=A0AAI9TTS2_9PEZI|nr:hypothetical protein CCUS01_12624 [Colletotrichum cuscutae]